MTINRCQYIVKSQNIKGQSIKRKCYNKQITKIKIFPTSCYCFLHSNILYKDNVNTIIRYFRGYYIRKKLYYYKQLPCDVQYKIIYKMRENFYIDHYNCSISKILYNKVKSFNQEISDASITLELLSDTFIKYLLNRIYFNDEWALNLVDKMFNLYKLLNKFKLIINKKIKNILNYLLFCGNKVNEYMKYSPLIFFHHIEKVSIIITFNNNFNDLKF